MKVKRCLLTLSALLCTIFFILLLTQMRGEDGEFALTSSRFSEGPRGILHSRRTKHDWRRTANHLQRMKQWKLAEFRGGQRRPFHHSWMTLNGQRTSEGRKSIDWVSSILDKSVVENANEKNAALANGIPPQVTRRQFEIQNAAAGHVPESQWGELHNPLLSAKTVRPGYDQREATSAPLGPNGATIITALMDIGRGNWTQYRRPYSMYMDYMTRLLALDINLVAFTDAKGAQFVKEHRKERLQKTIIQEITLSQLPLFTHYQRIQEIIEKERANWSPDWDPSMRTHPESMSSEYDILMNSKPYFVYYVANWNPFNSSYFYWLDGGYGHGTAQYPPAGSNWAPENIMNDRIGDKVTFIQLGPGDLKSITLKDMYRKGVTVVNGGFFGGNKRAVSAYYLLHNRIFEDLLKKDYVDDDQTLIVLCYQQNGSLFNMVVGDWYDVFRLFQRTREKSA